ncbi:MAG TPA: peptidoglycan-binding protein [Oscillatoriaceae cyanobacterium]
MTKRRLLIATLAASLGVVGVSAQAQAAWNGLKHFNCMTSAANWHFDGLYGRDTQAAVKAFQKARGINADGVAGPRTLKELGLSTGRTLRCGDGGNDVLKLQHALSAAGFWYGQTGKAVHPRPSATPTPMPTPMETPTPMYTPMATPTPMETPMPEMTPVPEMTPEETPSPEVQGVTNEPTLDLWGGAWMLPVSGTAINNAGFNWNPPISFSYQGGADLWWGNWGIGGDVTRFNLANSAFNLGPLMTNNTYLYDADLKYRWDSGFWNWMLGYRGDNMGLNMGQIGLAYTHPLGLDWLWINLAASGGYGNNNSWDGDGKLGLGLRFGWFGIDADYRYLYLNAGTGTQPTVTLNGPEADIRLAF